MIVLHKSRNPRNAELSSHIPAVAADFNDGQQQVQYPLFVLIPGNAALCTGNQHYVENFNLVARASELLQGHSLKLEQVSSCISWCSPACAA